MKNRNILCGLFFLFLTLSAFISPARAWWGDEEKIVLPEGRLKKIKWTDAELEKDPVKRDLGETREASFHIIRLQNAEAPHVHETHDLTAVVTKGMGIVHYGEKSISISKGDIVRIPRGVPHWVENTGNQALEAYAIFMPPFDGKDMRPLGPPPPRRNQY